jgi:hypothetical protein
MPAWLTQFLAPLVARVIIEIIERAKKDAEFQKKMSDAVDLHKVAKTKEERANVRKTIQGLIRDR